MEIYETDMLIQKVKRHDKKAFAELFKQNEKAMYKVAKAILKNDEDVADAMQETALICWEKISELRENKYFKTWLIRILINKCNSIYKQKTKFISNEKQPERGDFENGFANIEWTLLLDVLAEKFRTIIILYYVDGFKVREIAQILDISESTVKARLVEARKQVEKFYDVGKEQKNYGKI